MQPKNVEKIVLAATILHNFLRTQTTERIGFINNENRPLLGLNTNNINRSSNQAQNDRDYLRDYLFN